jgi:hypothetical protein
MLAELQSYPWKCVLEILLYTVILVYVLGLAPRLRRWVNNRVRSWAAALLSESAVWIGGWTLITGPLLILGYGASIYTTWAGPGWLSCSGPYLGMPTGFAGETVSYRPFLETFGAFPLLAIPARWFGPLAEHMRVADYVWLAGAVFWGAVGAVAGCLMRASARRVASP